ncbi:MAG TPA: S-layer homology domain-containing protein [Chloroflexia bacterium]
MRHPLFRLPGLVSFVSLVLLAVFAVGSGTPATANVQTQASSESQVHGADYTLRASSFTSGFAVNSADKASNTAQGPGSSLRLPAGSHRETFTSGVTEAPFDFTDVAPHWWAEVPEQTYVLVEVRTSRDGRTWGDWEPADLEDIIMPTDVVTQTYASTIAVPQVERTHRFVQSRVTLSTNNLNRTPLFHELTYTFIDAGVTSSPPKAQSATIQSAPGDVPKPRVVPRKDWGAPDGDSSPKWKPKYRRVTHIIIHHTATPNNDTDWAARVRAIWYYHANTRGWGDIGYNYLVDANGVIYEGRFGGDDVEGGHSYPFNTGAMGVGMIGNFMTASPSTAAQSSLIDLISWKATQRGIDPQGSGPLTGYTNCGGVVTYTRPTIAGHRDYKGNACGRDYNSSTCPGDRLWDMLPKIRDSIVAEQPPLRATFTQHDTPGNLNPGTTLNVKLTVRNSGSLTWPAQGQGAVSVGYRWLTENGQPVKGAPEARTPLPRNVPFADTLAITAKLSVPALNGQYVLMWDMYREGQGWFADQGTSAPLRVDVVLGRSPGDKKAPVSSVLPMPIYSNNPEFLVRWAGEDEAGGSGLASYDIQSRIAPNGNWTDWQSATSQTQAVFEGQDGYTYEFRSRARDAAGNVEPWPDKAQAYTTVDMRPPALIIDTPAHGAHIQPGPVQVKGKTEPGAFVAVNDTRAQEAGGVFTATVQVEGRDFIIHVSASDAAGNVSRQEVVVQAASRFNDVPLTDPASEAIETLSDQGIIAGYSDGSFKPDTEVTRAQFAKFLAVVMKWTLIKPPDGRFSDVPPDSALFTYVETAVARGAMRGYTDGTFKPNEGVLRADAVRNWVQAAGWKPEYDYSGIFLDVPSGYLGAVYLETAFAHGIITPDEEGNFRPTAEITRAELSQMVYDYLKHTKQLEPGNPSMEDSPE